MQITLSQLRTGDIQFAGYTNRCQLAVAVKHIEPGIGQRPTDRHASAWIGGMFQNQCGDKLGTFGRAIGLQYGYLSVRSEHLGQGMGIGDIAAGEQQTQCTQLRRNQWCVDTQHASDQNQYRQAFAYQ